MRQSKSGPIFDIGELVGLLRSERIQLYMSLNLTRYTAPFSVIDKMIVVHVPAISIMDSEGRVVEDENEIPRIFFTRDFELYEE